MANTFELLQTVELTSNATSMSITGIPTGYGVIKLIGRIKGNEQYGGIRVAANGVTYSSGRGHQSFYNAGGGQSGNDNQQEAKLIQQSGYSTLGWDYFETECFNYYDGQGINLRTNFTSPYIQNTFPGGGFTQHCWITTDNLSSLQIQSTSTTLYAGTKIEVWGAGS